MSPTPIFVASTAELKKKLRLSGPAAGTDGEAILFDSMLVARSLFLRTLGDAQVAYLLGITFDENTLTSTGMLRVLANTTEVKIVWRELLRRMKPILLDAAGVGVAAFNDEPFKDYDSEGIAKELARLDVEIAEALEILSGAVAKESWLDARTFEPEETPPRPFESVSNVDSCF